jgi:hypothetical protein
MFFAWLTFPTRSESLESSALENSSTRENTHLIMSATVPATATLAGMRCQSARRFMIPALPEATYVKSALFAGVLVHGHFRKDKKSWIMETFFSAATDMLVS